MTFNAPYEFKIESDRLKLHVKSESEKMFRDIFIPLLSYAIELLCLAEDICKTLCYIATITFGRIAAIGETLAQLEVDCVSMNWNATLG